MKHFIPLPSIMLPGSSNLVKSVQAAPPLWVEFVPGNVSCSFRQSMDRSIRVFRSYGYKLRLDFDRDVGTALPLNGDCSILQLAAIVLSQLCPASRDKMTSFLVAQYYLRLSCLL